MWPHAAAAAEVVLLLLMILLLMILLLMILLLMILLLMIPLLMILLRLPAPGEVLLRLRLRLLSHWKVSSRHQVRWETVRLQSET